MENKISTHLQNLSVDEGFYIVWSDKHRKIGRITPDGLWKNEIGGIQNITDLRLFNEREEHHFILHDNSYQHCHKKEENSDVKIDEYQILEKPMNQEINKLLGSKNEEYKLGVRRVLDYDDIGMAFEKYVRLFCITSQKAK